jgi:hypothetical protein
MKIAHIEPVRLVEGLDRNASRTYRLWESAGQVLKEFQLDQKQIDQLFAQVEKDATAFGGNRTALGKGLDVTTEAGKAVKQAYDDLVDQVQTSGPVKNFDALYDQATEKLKAATGGDSGAMSYVQKYRDFAKKHPIAQGVIYSALIAAAGLSGAGLGGAAAIGLFKMTDRLLQGDKFSSALGKGAVAGGTAYAASSLLGGGDLPSDPNAPGYQVGADGPASAPGQFDVPPETSQNFGLTPGGVDPNATQNAIDSAAKTAADAAEAGAKSAATDAAKQAATKGSDAAALAADPTGGGVTDIDTLKQGIAGNSDAAMAATNTDAASAMASQSDATVNTATDFTSQGAPAGQAASGYAPSADTAAGATDTAASATDTATQAVKSATSRLADAAPGSMKYSQAEKMLESDLLKSVREAVTSGELGDPTERGYTFKITKFVRDYIDQNSDLVQQASGKSLSGTSEKLIGMKAELVAKQVASGLDGASGTANWAGGALQKAGSAAVNAASNAPIPAAGNFVQQGMVGTNFENKQHKGQLIKEYIDAQSTVRHWALKESLGRPRGGVRLTEAGVNRVFALVEAQALNEGIMDTVKGAVKSAGQGIAGVAKKAGAAIAQTGKNLTTKFTADKLKQAWEAEGGNTDSEAIKIFLKQQGVDSSVIDSSMKAIGAPAAGADAAAGGADAAKDAAAGADTEKGAAAGAPPAAGGSQFVQDLVAGYMALSAADRAEIMKELDVAIDVSGNSNLVKGMNESKRRKKKAVR